MAQVHVNLSGIVLLLCNLALAGFDYLSVFSVGTFNSGSKNGATRCVDISIIDDSALELQQAFEVILTTEDSQVILGSVVATTITIMDNDG